MKLPGGSDKSEVKQLITEAENNNDTTIWTITGGHAEDYQVYLKLDNKSIKIELDIGVAVSVMLEQQWKATFGDIKPTSHTKNNHYKHTQDMKHRSGHKQTWMWSMDIKDGNYHC